VALGASVRHVLPNADWWPGKRVLVTGHSGFVGGWLTLWLSRLGAKVSGYSLPATDPSFYRSTGIERRLNGVAFADIRDAARLSECFRQADPEIVFHLAAQPIVRNGYLQPSTTFSTNIIGTVNVLEGCRGLRRVGSIVIFTTDKVYENDQSGASLTEDDRLGGSDPYSASKAGAELVAAAYRRSYFQAGPGDAAVVTVRAGNILGGGDWAPNRLVPDAMRAFSNDQELVVRRPDARRPWQHVLDCVRGLLVLAQEAPRFKKPDCAIGWNLGPPAAQTVPVRVIADQAARLWGRPARWRHEPEEAFTEAQSLVLSAEKAARDLGWRCLWDIARTMQLTIAWYRAAQNGASVLELSEEQIGQHESDARAGAT
jgi:CDP-glucose 4,6-dehydratase